MTRFASERGRDREYFRNQLNSLNNFKITLSARFSRSKALNRKPVTGDDG